MSQIINIEAGELKLASIYWSEPHQCVIYAVKNGGNYVLERDMNGDLYYNEVEVVINTPQKKRKNFFESMFL